MADLTLSFIWGLKKILHERFITEQEGQDFQLGYDFKATEKFTGWWSPNTMQWSLGKSTY